jgi:hypothetical protein
MARITQFHARTKHIDIQWHYVRKSDGMLLENLGIPHPFRIHTNSLKVLELEFKVLDKYLEI